MKDLLLGIDLGAGSLKATLISLNGDIIGDASHSVPTCAPRTGWSEQNPEDWWKALVHAVPRAIGRNGKRVAAISFSAGAHTAVLADADGTPIRNAIMWNDQRSHEEVNELRANNDLKILGPVDNHLEAMRAATRFQHAA